MLRFGLIGYPVSHSLSPRLFEAAYGGRFRYDLIEEEDFEKAWKTFAEGPYRAVNVTAPFKEKALRRVLELNPDSVPQYVREIGACNILLKTSEGIRAYNSDYLGIRKYLLGSSPRDVAVVGFGGAGKAAVAAARSLGLQPRLYRHDGIAAGLEAELVIYTLPRKVEGSDLIKCRTLFEANYRNPALSGRQGYVSGLEWLRLQAIEGYALMTGEAPDKNKLRNIGL